MATLRNKRKLADVNKEICDERPRSNLVQSSSVPRSQEDYITQVSEENEGRVREKLSLEFNRTECRILGALSRSDDIFLKSLNQGHSMTVPEALRRLPGTYYEQTKERMRKAPRVMLILKRVSLRVKLHETLVEMTFKIWR